MAAQTTSTHLILAVERDDLEELLAQLARPELRPQLDALVPWRDHRGIAPLHLASSLAAVRSIEALLAAGASATATDAVGQSCVHRLAASSAPDEAKTLSLQLLSRAGADADATTAELQQTPLHIAAREASTSPSFLARLVLAARETSAYDAAGRTPLHYVALSAFNDPERLLQLAEVLIRYAAIDPRDADAEGMSAADLAELRGKPEVAAGLRAAEARAAQAGRCFCCRCCPMSLAQPLIFVFFLCLAHAAAGLVCLPCLSSAWPTLSIACIVVVVALAGFATAAKNPGYLPRFAPTRSQRAWWRQQHEALLSPARQSHSDLGGGLGQTQRSPPLTPNATRAPAATVAPSSGDVLGPGLSMSQPAHAYCHSCRAPKPLRSKHCRTCDRCVAEFDHHCPWLGACIGLHNRGCFYVFVTAITLDVVALGALGSQTALSCGDLGGSSWLCHRVPAWCAALAEASGTAHAVRVALAVIASVVGAPLLWFWACRTRNVAANLTTNERYNQRRYAHFRRSDGTIANPFDHGCARNCVHYFCAAGPTQPREAPSVANLQGLLEAGSGGGTVSHNIGT